MQWVKNVAERVSARNRAAKFSEFMTLLAPGPAETILDIGVNDIEYSESENYLEKHYPHAGNITAVAQTSLNAFQLRYPAIRALVSDGRRLPFADDEFDISYSNAVIEHVGDRPEQLLFLREQYRVARRGYLTTPNRFFPVEVHTHVPLFHILLPRTWFDRLLRLIGKGWAAGDYMHLLTRRELASLLDEAAICNVRVTANRFLGWPMTYTVVWNKAAAVQTPDLLPNQSLK